MRRYHYIDDQGNISDALPLAALHKIGLPPATKVLLEGGKQWTTLAQVSQGGSIVLPPPPLPTTCQSQQPPQPNLVTPSKQPDQKTGTGEKPQSNAKGCLGCLGIIVVVLIIIGAISDHTGSSSSGKCQKTGCENKGQGWYYSTGGEKSILGMQYGALKTDVTGGYCSRQHCNDGYP